jgi:hypothetical protein
MSAYVVDKETIDTLIAGALRAKLFGLDEATANGQMLWRENVTSVSFRYNLPTRDATELAEYEGDVEAYEFTPCDPTGPAIDSAIDCLDYQSCEHDGWEASAACALLRNLRIAFPAAPPVPTPRRVQVKPYMWRGTLNGV